jgi:hypothetical protein
LIILTQKYYFYSFLFKFLNKKQIQGFSRLYLNLESRFLVYFSNKSLISGLSFFKSKILISRIFDMDYFYKKILLCFINNINTNSQQSILFDYKIFAFVNLNYNKFLNYFFTQNNFVRKNTKKPSCFLNLQGFKFHFLGRFSRKQRASSITFNYGKMPLNTLDLNIKFFAETVPLINSIINTKI